MPTTAWVPNQAAVAQVETYTFSAPSGVGNWYQAVVNGKTLRYSSISGDTAASACTALYALLNQSSGIAPELTEVQFADSGAGTLTATARVPGTPFANVTVNGVAGQGLVLSTGNGLANGIATTHTTPSASPSDVNDSQNWLRYVGSAPGARSLPQNGDDVVASDSAVPMLWNLDLLAAVRFNSYARHQSMTGEVGLPPTNARGYTEWRATEFKFSGPAGSVPSGGVVLVLGLDGGSGDGPSRERYDLGSSAFTLRALAAGSPQDDYGVQIFGSHTNNVVFATNGVSVGVAMAPGRTSQLNSVVVAGGATVAVGAGVAWATTTGGAASACAAYGGNLLLNAAPASLVLANGATLQVGTDGLAWPSISAQGGSNQTWLAGGTITALTMSQGCALDKSGDGRALTITNCTIDGDTCVINDPLNTITFTNPASVKQQVTAGPFLFTGTRTVRVL